MRGDVEKQPGFFHYMNVEAEIPADHPLRAIKEKCDAVLVRMQPDFDAAYSRVGRPGIPPEHLLKALLLQALYSIRSETQLVQAIQFNILYRWFLDMAPDAKMWTPETFSMNRERFESHDLLRRFFDAVVEDAVEAGRVSAEHFTVDGTLIRSMASLKSLAPRDTKKPGRKMTDDDPGNPSVDFHGEKRGNATHVSGTDPEARLWRKGNGKEAHLYHSAHVLMENRNGLCVDIELSPADGRAERNAALSMVRRARRVHGLRVRTLGMDAGYDDGKFIREMERRKVVAHVAIREGRIVSRDANGKARRRARERMKTAGYRISQRIRKRIEEIFGWGKTIGRWARTRFVGRWKIVQEALMTAAAYNLIRLARM
jgi:transposase